MEQRKPINLPTYDGSGEIVVIMLKTIEINNLRYEQGDKVPKLYKIPYELAKELCKAGYCYYALKPEDWFKEELSNEK